MDTESLNFTTLDFTKLFIIGVKMRFGHIQILSQPPARKACGVIVSGLGFVVGFRCLYKLHALAAIYRKIAKF